MNITNSLDFFKNKKIVVTGAAGTVGREIVRQLFLEAVPAEIRALDNNESEIFYLEEEYKKYNGTKHKTLLHAYVGDVRDEEKLKTIMKGADIVFHCAALKHVIVCERSPFDAVLTNIQGVQNVINAAVYNNVERVIFTSSDKAVNPTNVMGTSKLMGERLITAANNMKQNGETIFTSTRFGNVIGSRGSVVPLFYNQIKAGGPVTLTDPRMTRFIMTIHESARLVLNAAEIARGGEVFVMKMPVIKIEDLAKGMVHRLKETFGYKDVEVKTIGAKPGEKLYEELMSQEETSRSVELADMFSVLPAFRGVYENIVYDYKGIVREEVDDPYISSKIKPMGRTELIDYLESHNVFEMLV